MDVLNLDGKKYVKASSIARELGYTADYVGQLCRANKVEAHLVGRSWYVLSDSLKSHKQEKSRSNVSKSREEIERQKETVLTQTRKTTNTNDPSRSYFYNHSKVGNFKYEEDTSELIPVLKKVKDTGSRSVEIDIEPEGAKSVPVESNGDDYRLSFTKKPEVRFKGEIGVTEVEDAEDAVDDTQVGKESAKTHVLQHTESTKVPLRHGKTDIKQTRARIPVQSEEIKESTQERRVMVHAREVRSESFAFSTVTFVTLVIGVLFVFSSQLFVVKKIEFRSGGNELHESYEFTTATAFQAYSDLKTKISRLNDIF